MVVKSRTSIGYSSGCRCRRLAESQGRETPDCLRRYTLIKAFLTEILGVEEEIAAREAQMLQHVLSIRTTQKMTAFQEQFVVSKSLKS